MKKRIWEILETHEPDDRVSKYFDFFVILLVTLNVAAFILETEKDIYNEYNQFFEIFELVAVVIFTIEYLLRLITCNSDPEYKSKYGRIKYLFTPLAIVDFLAIAPYFITALAIDSRIFRILRLFRILRILQSFRYSKALNRLLLVIEARSQELISSVFLLLCLLTITSTGIYFTEYEAQPEKFSSILSSMWWSVATLTTVGYGDVYPITALGKLFGSLSAVFGVGLFAIPTGILASGFSSDEKTDLICKHCGMKM